MKTIAELSSLAGRRALVTGAAGHIGFAICETLNELGATVAVCDREAAACERRVQELSSIRPGGAHPFACDLQDIPATRQMVRDVVRRLGGLDIAVHCAAYVGTDDVPGWAVPFEQQSDEPWESVLRVNVTAAFSIVQEAQRALSESGHGSVLFISSIYGLVGPDIRLYEGTNMGNPAAYGVSKGGLLQLMRYLATVCAPTIRVNALSPGGLWRNQKERFVQRYNARTPLGRMATEEDLKGAVAFLASDLSAYVTGQNLTVDGGWTAW
ncbi:MAG TPA: SDR family oxidoreductase [Nitrospiraceae bacterium]|jgi:NAD(P)-dependent dehydrogenase (short-subunit alcohol dehydrogenase family)|nr:SDR family oxidoreductase [Nitrospiraceae bacterium]